MSSNIVKKFYQDVMDQLFEQSRVFWEEEGLDESTMQEVRQLWETKLGDSGVDLNKPSSQSLEDSNRVLNTIRGNRNANGNARNKNPPAPSGSPPVPPPTMVRPSVFPGQMLVQQNANAEVRLSQQPQFSQQNAQPQSSGHQSQQQQQAANNAFQNSASGMSQVQPNNFSSVIASQNNGEITNNGIRLIPLQLPLNPMGLASHGQPQNMSRIHHGQSNIMQPSLIHQAPSASQVDIERLFSRQDRSGVNQQMDRFQQQQQMENRSRVVSQGMPQPLTPQQRLVLEQQMLMRNRQMGNMSGMSSNNSSFSSMSSGDYGNMPYAGGMSHNRPYQQQAMPPNAGYPSVIHVIDRSGNQQALPAMNLSVENMNHSAGAGKQGSQGGKNAQNQKNGPPLAVQLDGLGDDSFEDLSDEDDASTSARTPRSIGHAVKKIKKTKTTSERLEESDLDSGDDDDDDDDPSSQETVDNVVVCQYEKISRTRNKWKFHLKSGMCSLNGKEYIFHKATGDAEF